MSHTSEAKVEIQGRTLSVTVVVEILSLEIDALSSAVDLEALSEVEIENITGGG